MTERRSHPRKQRTLDFYCYLDGQRFDSSSLDVSEGGAFLATPDPVPLGATVLVVPKSIKTPDRTPVFAESGSHGVLLVGRMVRRQTVPRIGVGIQWVKCVSRGGLDALYTFLGVVLEVFPASLPTPDPTFAAADTIAWDFERQRFQLMEITRRRGETRPAPASAQKPPGSSPPKSPPEVSEAPEAPPLPPVAMTRGNEDGAITTIISHRDSRVPVRVPVEFYMGDTIWHGTVVAMAAGVLTLRLTAAPSADVSSIVLSFPLSYKGQTELLYLACKVGRVTEDADGSVLVDLSIRGVDNEPSPGIFLRYVKYLYFHRVVDAE